MRIWPVMMLMVAFLAASGSPAHAQAICGSRAALLKQLEVKYKEAVISMGLTNNGAVVELTRSETGTWTLLLTNPAGLTCLMAAGEHWETLRAGKKGEGT